MDSFEEYRKLHEEEQPGIDQTGSIEQVPQPAPPDHTLANVLSSAGLGLVMGVLGAYGLKQVQKALYRSGYGSGPQAFVRYAKNLVGIKPYQPHKFTPEEQKAISRKFSEMMSQERAAMRGKDEAKPTEDNNPLLADRIKDFIGRIFNPAKSPRRATAALARAVIAFSRNAQPEQTDVQTVLGALSSGSASDEFKTWYSANATKAKDINKTIGAGKNKRPLQYTKYDLGKLPMKQIDFGLIVKFFRSIYGHQMSGKTPEDAKPQAKVIGLQSDAEKQARDHRLDVTANALQSNRGEPAV
jgi:hypothetical protein